MDQISIKPEPFAILGATTSEGIYYYYRKHYGFVQLKDNGFRNATKLLVPNDGKAFISEGVRAMARTLAENKQVKGFSPQQSTTFSIHYFQPKQKYSMGSKPHVEDLYKSEAFDPFASTTIDLGPVCVLRCSVGNKVYYARTFPCGSFSMFAEDLDQATLFSAFLSPADGSASVESAQAHNVCSQIIKDYGGNVQEGLVVDVVFFSVVVPYQNPKPFITAGLLKMEDAYLIKRIYPNYPNYPNPGLKNQTDDIPATYSDVIPAAELFRAFSNRPIEID